MRGLTMAKRKQFSVGYQSASDTIGTTAGDKLKALKAQNAQVDKEVEKAIEEAEERNKANTGDIPYELLDPMPNNRNAEREIGDLADKILNLGLIHYLFVRKKDDGRYAIISGERRYRAIGEIRKSHANMFITVPCTIARDGDPLTDKLRQIEANRVVLPTLEEQRKDIEEAYQDYLDRKNSGEILPDSIVRMIASARNQTERTVQRIISINQKLIPELQNLYDEERLTQADAAVIAQLDPIYQEEIRKIIINKGKVDRGEIAYYSDANKTLAQENPEEKAKLDQVRSDIKKLKSEQQELEGDAENDDRILQLQKEVEEKEETIKSLTDVIQKRNKPSENKDVSEMGRHLDLQNTIARLERAQNKALREAKGLSLDEIERARIEKIIEKLQSLL